MNELQLSNDLTTIETEIKSYQNIAGQSIFEIGRRLKHVKENDLAHGEWSDWLKSVNLNRTQATKFIKVSEEFSDDSTWNQLGLSALYMIATLPEEERTVEHKTSNGEIKKPIDMTNRELEDLKRQLKQRNEQNAQLQSQVEQAQRSEEIAKKQLEDAESREPEVIEKYTEPEDYQSIKNMNEHLESEREYYKKLADDFRNEVKGMMDQSNQEIPLKKEDDYEDYTSILLKILEPSEVFIENYKNNLNEQEIINKLEKIIKKLKEQ
ncbi:DUF3102 domain-containing protein [Staphylococcus pettenkoferi]|uniref:DUF3102 domain-containing protein n=1 Tax=Staphylococcus pettenkoferi TaxID=170573 RepID=A0ABT4BNU1_9STAP|nr:DUF3102 domain-containing protein [Staphylococcus pettenkoferi]MCY1564146.1 DUF3102 domain-containing protein [Staphylococcus pettenkoferi]MCY1571329.1 DUF3102 domain-containing protein [Staphylococcus pettenkoferi]MCY1584294.1 DUF3102 domain-containing protein [Staphylococcus pettenkoferi]MCY1606694.1 DUF3102 domain-containing protein [Staphylococcus pettenkoferi]MDH9615664.1 DUF3102 domain-containing protein [Staphylococcus pettenkoferi]